MKLSCQEFQQILELLEIEQAPDLVAMKEHLRHCRGCHDSFAEVAMLMGVDSVTLVAQPPRPQEPVQGSRGMRWSVALAAAACVLILLGLQNWQVSTSEAEGQEKAELVSSGKPAPDRHIPLRIETTAVVPSVSGDGQRAQVVTTRFVFEQWQPKPSRWLKEKP